jgi:hypothetical protein
MFIIRFTFFFIFSSNPNTFFNTVLGEPYPVVDQVPAVPLPPPAEPAPPMSLFKQRMMAAKAAQGGGPK